MTGINIGLAIYLGLLIGGFSTVLVPRIQAHPHGSGLRGALRSLSFPPSSCACGRKLSFFEKLPLLGWLAARGQCRGCASAIPAIYPVAELCVALTLVFLTAGAWEAAPAEFALLTLIPVILFVIAGLLLPVAPRPAAILVSPLLLLAVLSMITGRSGGFVSALPGGLSLIVGDALADILPGILPEILPVMLGAAILIAIGLIPAPSARATRAATRDTESPRPKVSRAIRLGSAAAMALLSTLLPGAPEFAALVVFPVILLSYRLPDAFNGQASRKMARIA